MKYFNTSTRLRLKNRATPNLPSPEKIPILIPQKSLDAIKAEGSYEFVEAIEVPTEGTGGIYTKEYFQSLLDYMRLYPMGGNKDGHEASKDDVYTIGGELQMKSENEGVCYFRVHVPSTDWNGNSNVGLIRSLKAGTLEMSLVSDVEPVRGNDGKLYFTKELGKPRNDIVPEGAMSVTLGNSQNEKEIMALIEQGAIDMESESKELVKNGKVFRKAAVNLQSTSDKSLGGRVLNAIAAWQKNQKPKRRNNMGKYFNADGEPLTLEYKDVFEWFKNAITNNQITSEKLMTDLGYGNKLRKNEDEQREKLASAIIAAIGLPAESTPEQIIEAVTAILKENDAVAESTVNAVASEFAGGKTVKNADETETENPVYLYAKNQLKGLRGKQLNDATEKLKADPIAISLRSKQADTRVNAKETNAKDGSEKKSNINIREV